MALEFAICEVWWERYRRVSKNPQARERLEYQAARGLAANTTRHTDETWMRIGFLEIQNIPFHSVVRPTIGAYIRSIAERTVPKVVKKRAETRTRLANTTLQQHLTAVFSPGGLLN
jgi:hypothetical protein